MKFLPEIKHGDKRIILVNGEPIAALRRIPKNNEIRSNIHVGGNCEAVKISRQDLNICEKIKGFLKDESSTSSSLESENDASPSQNNVSKFFRNI